MKLYILLFLAFFALSGCLPQSIDSKTKQDKNEQTTLSPPHPVSIDAWINKNFIGSDFTIGQILADTALYTRYYITYKSGELTISGIMNVPKGEGPFQF